MTRSSPKSCPLCQVAVEQPATGRPRVDCPDPCKRAASYRITRLNRLLFRMESWLLDLRLKRGDYWNYDTREQKRDIARIQKEVDQAEAQIREILAGQADV